MVNSAHKRAWILWSKLTKLAKGGAGATKIFPCLSFGSVFPRSEVLVHLWCVHPHLSPLFCAVQSRSPSATHTLHSLRCLSPSSPGFFYSHLSPLNTASPSFLIAPPSITCRASLLARLLFESPNFNFKDYESLRRPLDNARESLKRRANS